MACIQCCPSTFGWLLPSFKIMIPQCWWQCCLLGFSAKFQLYWEFIMIFMKRYFGRFASVFAVLALLMQVQSANATPGAYSSFAVGKTIYSKNYGYQTDFPIVGSPPASTINNVSYSWGLSYYPSGLVVYLCHGSTSACLNITNSRSGTTSAFSTRNPQTPFFLYYYVNGTGTMAPAYG